MKIKILFVIGVFISAILQFISFVLYRDPVNLTVSVGMFLIDAIYIYKICKENETDDIEE